MKYLVHLTETEFKNIVVDAVRAALEKGASPNCRPPKYITRKQASELLFVSLMTLNEWRKKGILIPRYIGGRALYMLSEIESIINNKK